MSNDLDLRGQIKTNLLSFLTGDLRQNALGFLETLGYKSNKKHNLQPNTSTGFKSFLKQNSVQLKNEKKAHLDEWQTVDFLFQLTDEEVSQSKSLFDSNNIDVSDKRIESYLFFAIKLKESDYRRSVLAEITREINRTFPMPVMILFQHSTTLTFSIIDRRLHKRDESKDVLEKVTLIKDIRLENPHRAHIEILKDLALQNYDVRNFVELHNAWQKTLDTKELNKKFFQELANWYFWAVDNVKFPADEEKNKEVRNATSVIRLITRLMFVWFLKEKGLVSDKLFDEKHLKTILHFKEKSAFYKAILQNLFFATLNSEMGKREFRKKGFQGKSQHYGVHNVFRYEDEFIKPQETVKELFEPIPFLNGGLFECLDKPELNIRVDGFSDREDNVLQVPNKLFFGAKHSIDLNETYGTKNRKYEVQGLINLLNNYKFTIAENTPIEEEIALDPELLGKVFENLLASYNPETKTTARKQTGSFYTPREIVNYMVDESLIAYLKAKLQTETEGFSGFVEFGKNQPTMFGNEMRVQQAFETPVSNNRWHGKDDELETVLRDLFTYTEGENKFNELETEILIKAIDNCKILDPACGSGAFPMGILHRLVHLLEKLDKENEKWKEWQKQKAIEETKKAYDIGDHKERDDRLKEISDIFENNANDYGRKLFLIENCIYGVDIQPIAIQIAKLRFFISLIVDQRTNAEKKNLGILPLPNLETKFVAANTLIGLETSGGLKPNEVYELEEKLKEVRAKHFSAKSRRTKEKYREEDKRIRSNIADVLKQAGFPTTSADQIAAWNPYDQNKAATWFDSEYMFGIEKGFDIVIGNPPYFIMTKQSISLSLLNNYLKNYSSIKNSSSKNLFVLFIEHAINLLSKSGVNTFIVPEGLFKTRSYSDCVDLLNKKGSIFNVTEIQGMIFENAHTGNVVYLFAKNTQKKSKTYFFDNNFNLAEKVSRQQPYLDKMEVTGKNSLVYLKDVATLFKGMVVSDRKSNIFEFQSAKNKDKFLLGNCISKWTINKYFYTNYQNIKVIGGTKSKSKHDTHPRIIIRRTGDFLCCAYLEEKSLTESTLYSCWSIRNEIDNKYLIGLFHSKLLDTYIKNTIITNEQAFPQILMTDLELLPIPKATYAQQTEIAALVDKIIAAKKADVSADTSKLERKIDEMVYQLYGLNDEEIAIVESK